MPCEQVFAGLNTISMKYTFRISIIVCTVIFACTNSKRETWQGECPNSHDIGTIEIMPSLDRNALRVLFTVETAQRLDSYIRYWEYTGTDTPPPTSQIFYSPICKKRKKHELMLVNIKPETKYNFNVVIQNKVCKTHSKTYDFTSPKMPAWLPFYANADSLKDINFNGYVHFHSRMKLGYLYLANSKGELVWYKKVPMTIKVSKFTNASTFLTILSDDTLRFASGNKIAEIDLFGQLLYHYDSDEKGEETIFHHEIDYDMDGNLMTLISEKRVVDLSGIGGNKQDTIKGDGILVMNKKDEVIWKWSVFDVMNPSNYKNILNERHDWLHANALCQDSVGNYLISFRNNSQIWKIEKGTGRVMWKLGGDEDDFNLPDNLKFHGQHNVHFNKDGHLVFLDNGNKLVKPGFYNQLKKEKRYGAFMKENSTGFTSRQLTFNIDDNALKAILVDEAVYNPEFLTKSQGSSQHINEDLLLFCSTNSNSIVFANSSGECLGRIPLERPSYRAQYIPELYSTSYVK